MKLLLIVDRDGTLIKDCYFLGRNNNWKEEIKLNFSVVKFLKYIQSKHNCTTLCISNQSGVAKKFFTCETVNKINLHINYLLLNAKVKINCWVYCPCVDREYAQKSKYEFNENYVQDCTTRKPSIGMIYNSLMVMKKRLENFDKIIVIGNSDDDKMLASMHDYPYIDVTNKTYPDLMKECKRLMVI